VQLFYPLERLLSIRRLVFTANGLSLTTSDLHHEQFVPITERLFRKENQSAATLALLPDAEGKTLIQSGWGTFKQVSALRVWGQRVGLSLILLLTLSSPLFALVWGWRKFFGKLHDAGPLSVRLLPLLSTVLLMVFLGTLATGLWPAFFGDYIAALTALGVPSLLTVAVMLSSIAFPLAAAASLYVVYRERSTAMNRMAYWHSVLVALAMAAVAVYMGYWGLIGLCLWA
jgi:hypothetical protein